MIGTAIIRAAIMISISQYRMFWTTMLSIRVHIVAAYLPAFIAVFPYLIMIPAKVVINLQISFMNTLDLAAVSSVTMAA